MATIQAVILDYGGVLRADGREGWDAIDEFHRLPRGALWSAYHDIPEYPLARRGEIEADAFRAGVRRRLATVAGGEALADTVLAALDQYMEGLPPVDAEMRALVVRLRAAGKVKLGLLSNANRGWTDRLRARCGDLFDDVVVSGDVGLAKPDPEVFRLAARRLGVDPTACLMIDDQAQHLESAGRVGLRTHLFTHARFADLVRLLESEGVLG
jgi:epoxide hydrolase-like predicted phosphatase